MATKGRITELTRLHKQLSAGGNCCTPRALQKLLGQPLTLSDLPTSIYLQDFLDLFQSEATRLEALDRKLSENVQQYAIKRDVHAQFHRSAANGPNKLDLVVEFAQGLPVNSAHFLIKKNNTVVYRSMVKSKTANPSWHERYTVGIDAASDKIAVEIVNSSNDKAVGQAEIVLKTLEDQLVHQRTYYLKTAKLSVRAQWCYDQPAFHKIYSDRYSHMAAEEEKLLTKVSEKLNGMYALNGNALLRVWFCSPHTERKAPPARLTLTFESRHASTVASLVSTPPTTAVASRYSRPADLSEILAPRGRAGKLVAKANALDFFCVGIYKGRKA